MPLESHTPQQQGCQGCGSFLIGFVPKFVLPNCAGLLFQAQAISLNPLPKQSSQKYLKADFRLRFHK
jgi:hypothetical protein